MSFVSSGFRFLVFAFRFCERCDVRGLMFECRLSIVNSPQIPIAANRALESRASSSLERALVFGSRLKAQAHRLLRIQ